MSLTLSKHNLKLYFSSIFIYGFGILLITILPNYQKNFNPSTYPTLLYLYLSYCLIGAVYYLFINKNTTNNNKNNNNNTNNTTDNTTTNKSFTITKCVKRNLTHYFNKNTTAQQQNQKTHLHHEEKTALLFLLVKFFFLPLLINFSYNHLQEIPLLLENFKLFPFLLTSLFMLDTFIFTLGYCTESTKLQNICKSVEPTFLGWFVTLICYPPFNSIVGQYVPWGASDYATFQNPTLSLFLQIIVILLLCIYVAASLSLGLKASNLTNRGIVTKFPYNIIRHPAYISKLSIWWLTLLPAIFPLSQQSIPFALGMLFWTGIYLARAYTEERHLSQDPDYQQYKEKVRYRFIPKVM